MPRKARDYIAGVPYHVISRGNNRQVCSVEVDDYQFYLERLERNSKKYGVEVHAYVLMTNHVHFIMTPLVVDSISETMKVCGSHYTQYMNKKYRRTGTLWEGRHKASAIEAEDYLLKCYRYVEVAANMVDRPEEYKWSSYGVNGYGDESGLVTSHYLHESLGASLGDRCYAYRELFKERLTGEDVHAIRKAAHYCKPLGDERFSQKIEMMAKNKRHV